MDRWVPVLDRLHRRRLMAQMAAVVAGTLRMGAEAAQRAVDRMIHFSASARSMIPPRQLNRQSSHLQQPPLP
jgi:hypothetical protein